MSFAGLWEQSDEVKGLHRRLLVSTIMSQRQAQVAHRRVVEHAAQLDEQRFLEQQRQTLQVIEDVTDL